MTTKLRIDVSQGLIDIEGDPELVREIYADFKTHLLSGIKLAQPAPPGPPGAADADEKTSPVPKSRAKRRLAAKRKINGDESGSGVVADSPKLDKNLDTSGLENFYNKFSPNNNAEKILLFLKFIIENLQIEKPNTDQIYTCFKAAGERIPKAFAQAFYDASSKKFGYINFNSSTDIEITIVGENYFNHTMKRKATE